MVGHHGAWNSLGAARPLGQAHRELAVVLPGISAGTLPYVVGLMGLALGGMVVLCLWCLARMRKNARERQRVEEALLQEQHELLEAKSRLTHILEGTQAGTWEWNVQTDETVFNARWAEILGYTMEELSPCSLESWKSLTHPEDLETAIQAIQAHFEGRTATYFSECRMRHKDGHWVWIQDRGKVATWTPDGKPLRMFGTHLDITDRKLAESLIWESERTYRGIFDSVTDAIYIEDEEGRFLDVNAGAEKIYGYPREHFVGKTPEFVSAPGMNDIPAVRALVLKALHGEPQVFEFYGLKANGQVFPKEVRAYPGTFFGKRAVISVAADITTRKAAEASLRQALDEAERLNAQLKEETERSRALAVRAEAASVAKSDFLANMSHEIRTPLNGVIGMMGLLLDTELSPDQRRFAETARSCGDSLLSVVNDVLDFSKIEAGKLDLECIDFDLRTLLDDFSDMIEARASQKGVAFICTMEPHVPPALRGDPSRLRQILTNLVGNALKFTPKGEIHLHTTLSEDRDQEVLLRFRVKDTGIGIPEDKIPLLFQSFTQVDASTTRRFGGTGLGLAITRRLAELMGGEVGVSSQEGLGSEFWFTAAFRKRLHVEDSLHRAHPALSRVRALVVDDNATNREILVRQLEAWGMRTTEACDGPSALRIMIEAHHHEDPFKVALVDMQMPGMDGEALGRSIQAIESLRTCRLVAFTSVGLRGDAKRFEEIGFTTYLTKPVHHADLFICLRETLAERARSAPTPIITRHSVRERQRSSARILLAEDNTMNQMVALGIMERLGFHADVASNGQEVVDALSRQDYDLVLMDVQMPEMDGLAATRIVRDPRSPVRNHHVPIVAITAHAMKGDREKCLEAGMNDYLSKPIEPTALLVTLERWLQGVSTQNPVSPEAPPPPGEAPSSVPAILDRAGLVKRLMGDHVTVQKALDIFQEEGPRRLEQLRQHLVAGNLQEAAKEAHTLKGAAGSLSCEQVRAASLAVEQACRADNPTLAASTLEELAAAVDRLLAFLATSRT